MVCNHKFNNGVIILESNNRTPDFSDGGKFATGRGHCREKYVVH